MTLKEIRAELVKLGVSAGWHALAVLRAASDDMEKKTAHAAEQDRPDILRRRWDWFEGQPDLGPDGLVFIDETWSSTNMARPHGRAPRGERLRAPVPHGHWKTTTFVAGLRNTGMIAPMVLDGPINGEIFQAYVEQALLPELRPGDIVVMDMCGRPCRSKENRQVRRGAWSGADMCTASGAARDMPRARMGVCGSDPLQPRALEALVHDLVFRPRLSTVAPYLPSDLPPPRRPRDRGGYAAMVGAL